MLELWAMRVAAVVILVASVAGCTVRDRYDAVYRENARECDLKVSEAERERCYEQLVPATYEEYERQRASALESPRPGSARGSPLVRERSQVQNGSEQVVEVGTLP